MRDEPAPFALRLVLAFLAFDAAERLGLSVWGLASGAEDAGWLAVVHALWIATNGLLWLLLAMRTRAGMWWLIVVFLIHLCYTIAHVTIQDPLLWVGIGPMTQVRVFATVLIDAALILLVSRREVLDVLTE